MRFIMKVVMMIPIHPPLDINIKQSPPAESVNQVSLDWDLHAENAATMFFLTMRGGATSLFRGEHGGKMENCLLT